MGKVEYNSSFVYRLCLDVYTWNSFEGRIYSSQSEDIIKFYTFDDFLVKMDMYMDIHGPQSYQDKRVFNSRKESVSSFYLPIPSVENMEKLEASKGEAETFTITIYSRRNAEWQGTLYTKDHSKTDFCNVISLTKLLTNNIKR